MDKECKYCIPEKEDEYGNKTCKFIKGVGRGGMWIFITNGKHILRSHATMGYIEINLNFCPVCGRKL